MTRRLLLLALPLALAACSSTMEREDCVNADWRTFGLEDGANGRKMSNIASYRQACSEYGVKPNLAEYQAGHATGARNFCTPSNGFATGRSGANGYENFCPQDMAGPFVAAYERGRTVHAADQRVARARSALIKINNEIDGLDESIVDATARITGIEASVEERVLLAKDLVEMGNRRASLTNERPQAERALSSAESELTRVLREYGE